MNGELLYHEWIILNPKKIKSISANGARVREAIGSELAKIQDPLFNYEPGEYVFPSGRLLKLPSWRLRVEAVLAYHLDARNDGFVPEIFDHGPSKSCEQFLIQ